MDALKERKYYQSWDKSFRITLLLQKLPFVNSVSEFILSSFCFVIRKIYSKKERTGVIAIINLHRLGDTVFTIPAIEKIYKHHKNYKIFICCYPESKPILALKFDEKNIITIDKNDFYLYRRIAKSKVRTLVKSLNPEIIYDLTGMPASASLIFSSKAGSIIGMNYSHLKGLYDKFTEIRNKPHFMDIYLDIIRPVIPFENENGMKEFPTNFEKRDKIIIHPFAIRKAKEWNLKRFINLAEDLIKDYDVQIISPAGFIQQDVKDYIVKKEIPFRETPGIEDLIDCAKKCSLFISNDSGPVYIASLLGKATFTIYGPTNPDYSLPAGKNHRYIMKQLKCSAKEEKFCFTMAGVYCPSNECLHNISTKEVILKIREFINDLSIEKRKIAVSNER